MKGERTKQLKYTILAALKYFPKNTLFNILEFGSKHTTLFSESVLPTAQNLHIARKRMFIPFLKVTRNAKYLVLLIMK